MSSATKIPEFVKKKRSFSILSASEFEVLKFRQIETNEKSENKKGRKTRNLFFNFAGNRDVASFKSGETVCNDCYGSLFAGTDDNEFAYHFPRKICR